MGLRDALLDTRFEELWPTVNHGTFVGDTSTSHHGLLEDLERRVAAQSTRLEQWKGFQEELQKTTKPASPAKRPDLLPMRSNSSRISQRKEKDLVFSPRKSPRKSMLPGEAVVQQGSTFVARKTLNNDEIPAKPPRLPQPTKIGQGARSDSDSSPMGDCAKSSNPISSPEGQVRTSSPGGGPKSTVTHGPRRRMSKADEEELLTEQIISLTMKTDPTPVEPKLSLVERTRQSMAVVSPIKGLDLDDPSPPPMPPQASDKVADPEATTKGSLPERTRQSISMVPAQARGPRKSMHARQSSKIYPTNQFETPRKTSVIVELTPPEELFSPGAGYDSVFKSRPKIAFSPSTSPVPSDNSALPGRGQGRTSAADGSQWDGESSPLARMATKA